MDTKQGNNDLLSMVLGAVTATGVGTLLFQALGALLLGIMGALGGYLFQHFLRPQLNRLFKKKNDKEA